jgi:TATA-box binding protein (TBP) (component of TFIID and TFIIIB)
MRIVNSNFKTEFVCPDMTLEKLHTIVNNTTLYTTRPKMLLFRKDGITMLIFNNFKVRLMGSGDCHEKVFKLLLEKISEASQSMPIILTSHTLVHHFDYKINLHKLNSKKFMNCMELFPSVFYKHNSNIHTNIFASGKVVLTGVTDLFTATTIINQLKIDLENEDNVFA